MMTMDADQGCDGQWLGPGMSENVWMVCMDVMGITRDIFVGRCHTSYCEGNTTTVYNPIDLMLGSNIGPKCKGKWRDELTGYDTLVQW
jgi:hypothetical protein